jgi:D-alanine-D-alanine ligase
MIDHETRIGVLMGGLSTEHNVSLKSGKSVVKALQDLGYHPVSIHVGRDLPARLIEERIEVAWLALHGRFGEDGCVQGLLEVMGIPYTGSDVASSAVAMDKIRTKQTVAGCPSIHLAKDWVVARGQPVSAELSFPVVVKPSVGGSTIGIERCEVRSELEEALTRAHALCDEVLVESFVEGDEITVAVLEGQALPVIRILPKSGFFDFEAKYQDGSTIYEVPAVLPDKMIGQAQRAAVEAYHALGCRGLCRVDFMVQEDVPIFLELNTLPGMTANSLSPMAAKAEGISFETLVERILLGAKCMPPEIDPSKYDHP